MSGTTWFEKLSDQFADDREAVRYELQLRIIEEMLAIMEKENMSRTDLAHRLDCSQAYVTKLLNGSQNLTLKTLVDLGAAIGHKVDITFIPKSANLLMRHYRYTAKSAQKNESDYKPMKVETDETHSASAA